MVQECYCVACFCCPNSSNAGVKKKLFRLPIEYPNSLRAWLAVLPKHPSGKVFDVKKSFICEDHFAPEDMIKLQDCGGRGKSVLMEFSMWKLKPGAVPKIFPGCPPHLLPNGFGRERRKRSRSPQFQKRSVSPEDCRRSPSPVIRRQPLAALKVYKRGPTRKLQPLCVIEKVFSASSAVSNLPIDLDPLAEPVAAVTLSNNESDVYSPLVACSGMTEEVQCAPASAEKPVVKLESGLDDYGIQAQSIPALKDPLEVDDPTEDVQNPKYGRRPTKAANILVVEPSKLVPAVSGELFETPRVVGMERPFATGGIKEPSRSVEQQSYTKTPQQLRSSSSLRARSKLHTASVKVKLPSPNWNQWRSTSADETSSKVLRFFESVVQDDRVVVAKALKVDLEHNTLDYAFYSRSLPPDAGDGPPELPLTLDSITMLEYILRKLHLSVPCAGIPDERCQVSQLDSISEGKWENGCWRSTKCLLFAGLSSLKDEEPPRCCPSCKDLKGKMTALLNGRKGGSGLTCPTTAHANKTRPQLEAMLDALLQEKNTLQRKCQRQADKLQEWKIRKRQLLLQLKESTDDDDDDDDLTSVSLPSTPLSSTETSLLTKHGKEL